MASRSRYGLSPGNLRPPSSASTFNSKVPGSITLRTGTGCIRDGSRTRLSRLSAPTQARTAFKSEEELHDDILELKRQLVSMKEENQNLKVKIRKMEEESVKKDRQIEQLMDPKKNDEIRRLLSDKGSAVVTNLKQRNFRLEKALKEKEGELKSLQGDIRATRVLEYKLQAETYFQEVLRLKSQLVKAREESKISMLSVDTPNRLRPNKRVKSVISPTKDLSHTVEMLMKENRDLKSENATLKDERDMIQNVDDPVKGVNKRLLSIIGSLEMQKPAELQNGSVSNGQVSCNGESEESSVSELKTLVSELHKDLERHKEHVRRLKSDREHFQGILSKRDNEIKCLKEKLQNAVKSRDAARRSVENKSPTLAVSPSRIPKLSSATSSSSDTESPKRIPGNRPSPASPPKRQLFQSSRTTNFNGSPESGSSPRNIPSPTRRISPVGPSSPSRLSSSPAKSRAQLTRSKQTPSPQSKTDASKRTSPSSPVRKPPSPLRTPKVPRKPLPSRLSTEKKGVTQQQSLQLLADDERMKRAESLRQNLAARKIQRSWKQYFQRKGMNSLILRSILRCHLIRKTYLANATCLELPTSSGNSIAASEEGSTELPISVELQCILRSHMLRKSLLKTLSASADESVCQYTCDKPT